MPAVFLNEDEFKKVLESEFQRFKVELINLLKNSKEDKKMNAREAAEFLGISLSTLYKKMRLLPHKKFGRRVVFRSSELEKLDASNF